MIEPLDTTSVHSLADWVEYLAIYENKPVSKARITTYLDKDSVEVGEEMIESVINEMDRRSSLYGNASPFTVDKGVIKPKAKWSETPELTMCLIFSLRGVKKKKGKDDGAKLFERLSKEAIHAYLGGEAKVIGFPNDRKLKEQIQDIAVTMCEEKGHDCPRPKAKDGGVDIIAWKSHGDRRPNQIILLIQCGAGSNWSSKQEIPVRTWKDRFFHFSATPIQGIAIPHIVQGDDFKDVQDRYNLIFDRVRIYKAIQGKCFSDSKLKKSILTWCKGNIN
jgi:hypothetical protein